MAVRATLRLLEGTILSDGPLRSMCSYTGYVDVVGVWDDVWDVLVGCRVPPCVWDDGTVGNTGGHGQRLWSKVLLVESVYASRSRPTELMQGMGGAVALLDTCTMHIPMYRHLSQAPLHPREQGHMAPLWPLFTQSHSCGLWLSRTVVAAG